MICAQGARQGLHAKSVTIVLIAVLLAAGASAQAGPSDDPMGYFNLYSLGDIGTPGSAYQGEVIGVAGAGGNVWFSSALHGRNSPTGYALHAGGSAVLSGTYLNSLEIGGNASLGNAGIAGSVVTGGDVSSFGPCAIGGDVLAAGSVSLTGEMAIEGRTVSGAAFSPMADHAALSEFFVGKSQEIGSLADTGGWTEDWDAVRFEGAGGVNVITVDAATLKDATSVTIVAPEDAVVYINVLDAHVELDWTAWRYEGGVEAADVLLNLANATSLDLSGTNAVNILAPFADTVFADGVLAGNLVVSNLEGSGQINPGSFEHMGPVPEPATWMLLLVLAVPILARRSRRARAGAHA